MKSLILVFTILILTNNAFAKKDFKGLFGSYRREKFTENEAKSNNFGMDLMLSTLFPIQDVVKSQESTGGAYAPLNYSVFYNVEVTPWYSINYHWVAYASLGWYSYNTRKENATTLNDPNATTTPIFHEFELKSFPIILGVRYRFLREDIVPYVAVGGGMAFTERTGSYDNDSAGLNTMKVSENVLAGHVALGVEFYFSPNAGLRIEASGYYLNISEKILEKNGGSPSATPTFLSQAHPMSIRYASGFFFSF